MLYEWILRRRLLKNNSSKHVCRIQLFTVHCVFCKDLRSLSVEHFSAEGQPVESLLTACWPDSSINTSCDYA